MRLCGGAVIHDEAFRIGHGHIEECLIREHEIVFYQIVGVEDVRNDRVGLVIGQRLRAPKRHRAAHIIERGRQIGPVGAHRLDRVFIGQTVPAAGKFGPIVDALGKIAVAGRTDLAKHFFARVDIA